MQCFSSERVLLPAAAACAVWMLAGCSWHHHPARVKSYDKSIDVGDSDPTYQEDPQRADVEVHYAQ
jgi:hypothetical protein